MILSLSRFGIAPAEQTYALEKGWAAFRKQNGLDLHGKSMDSSPPTSSLGAGINKSDKPSKCARPFTPADVSGVSQD